MPNFSTVGQVNLQSGDELQWEFQIPPAVSVTEKGAIPYNSNVASVVAVAYDADGVVVTSDLISGVPSVTSNIIYATFKYPIVNGEGRYKVTFLCTLDTGYTRQFDFGRIVAKNQ